MLVDDNALLVRELSAAIAQLGNVEVTAVAANEEQACEALAQQPPGFDVLVVDVFLSAGSGLGVLRAVRDLGLPVPAFVLSNFTALAVRKECIALGAERVFDKSAQLDEFLATLAALARRHGARTTVDDGPATEWP